MSWHACMHVDDGMKQVGYVCLGGGAVGFVWAAAGGWGVGRGGGLGSIAGRQEETGNAQGSFSVAALLPAACHTTLAMFLTH